MSRKRSERVRDIARGAEEAVSGERKCPPLSREGSPAVKSPGSILIDGGTGNGTELLGVARSHILDPSHRDPAVRKSRKVLLVTAAWQQEEFNEAHLKNHLYAWGVAPVIAGAVEENVQNLSLYHEFDKFVASEPGLGGRYRAKQASVQLVSRLYRRSTRAGVELLEAQLGEIKAEFPEVGLAELLDEEPSPDRWGHRDFSREEIANRLKRIQKNDSWLIRCLDRIEETFARDSALKGNPLWQKKREVMARRIRESATIVIYGGHLPVLINRLHFFDLAPVFEEALGNGTTIVARSAGTMVLGDRIVVYHDDHVDRHHTFELLGRGMGLVSRVLVLPRHVQRIRQDSCDHLAFLARRFGQRVCVGLEDKSLLLMETVWSEGQERSRYAAMRGGAVHFTRDGEVRRLTAGSELAVDELAGHEE